MKIRYSDEKFEVDVKPCEEEASAWAASYHKILGIDFCCPSMLDQSVLFEYTNHPKRGFLVESFFDVPYLGFHYMGTIVLHLFYCPRCGARVLFEKV